MTVIAWDGKTLAADKMAHDQTRVSSVTKIFKLDDGTLVGFAGSTNRWLEIMDWYVDGADKDSFRYDFKNTFTMAVIKDGVIKEYIDSPRGLIIEDKQHAWGSGDIAAIAAMKMGADAVQAVNIACDICPSCGVGVDSITY